MNFKECVDTLVRYSRARIPFIAVQTNERARALEMLKEVSKQIKVPFGVHTLTKGLIDLEDEKPLFTEDKRVTSALGHIAGIIRNSRQDFQTFIFTELNDLDTDSETSRYLLDIVSLAVENNAVIIVLTQNPVWSQLQRNGMTVSFDPPGKEETLEIINKEIEKHVHDIELKVEWTDEDRRDAASILSGLTEIEIQNVIASIATKREIKKDDLVELKFVKNRLFSNISGLEKIEIADSALTVGGLDGLRKWLNSKGKLQTSSKWDELQAIGLQPPRGILLVGVPGCGKSLSAKAIAASWKWPLFRLDFATVQGSYVGQSEQRLQEAFHTAERLSPCVLWIDEIEKGLGGNDSSGVTTKLVGQFLFWLQECKKLVFVVATANDVSTKLPPELLRRGRFDEIFFVDLPNEIEREDILKLYLKKYIQTVAEENEMKRYVNATEGFTGADIESAIRDIAYMRIADGVTLIDEKFIIKCLENVIPLSQTNPEVIEDIRAWGRERAVPASGRPIGDHIKRIEEQTKRGRTLIID